MAIATNPDSAPEVRRLVRRVSSLLDALPAAIVGVGGRIPFLAWGQQLPR